MKFKTSALYNSSINTIRERRDKEGNKVIDKVINNRSIVNSINI